MKLYVWREGVAFAVAESLDEAVGAVIAGGYASRSALTRNGAAWLCDDLEDRLRAELLAAEPAVTDLPCGDWSIVGIVRRGTR